MQTQLSFALYFALVAVWLFNLPYYRKLKKGWFNRKPFNCIFCVGFWLTLLGSIFIHLVIIAARPCFAMFLPAPCGAVLAVLIDRFITSLPITISNR